MGAGWKWDLVELLLGLDGSVDIILDRDRVHSALLSDSQRGCMAGLQQCGLELLGTESFVQHLVAHQVCDKISLLTAVKSIRGKRQHDVSCEWYS